MKNIKLDIKVFIRTLAIFLVVTVPYYLFPAPSFQSKLDEYQETLSKSKDKQNPSESSPSKPKLPKSLVATEAVKRCLQSDLVYQKIQSDKEYSLSVFFRSGRKNNIPPFELEQIAILSGVDIPMFRKAVLNYKPHETSLYRQSNQLAQLNKSYTKQLLTSKHSETPAHVNILPKMMDGEKVFNHQKMITDLKTGNFDLVAKQLKELNEVPLLVSQFDPITAALIVNPQTSFADLQLLHNSGVPYTLASLAQLSNHENGQVLAAQILTSTSDIPFKERWKAGFYVVNLLTSALQNNNIPLARFWFEQGVSARPIANGINAIDAFPSYVKSIASPEHKRFLLALLNSGIQPYRLDTKAKIREWFKDEPHILNTYDLNVQWQETQFEQRKGAVNHLKKILDKAEQRSIDQAQLSPTQFNSCTENMGYLTKRSQILQASNTKHKFTNQSPEQRLKELAQLELPSEAIPLIKPISKQLSNILWDLKKEDDDSAIIPEVEQIKRELRVSAAIRSFASLEEIISLLEEGYPMSKDAIHVIAQNGRTDLIDPLLNYGLDIEAKNDKGQNALFSAITGFKPFKTFNYLCEEKGLPIINGPELLLHAIQMNAYDKSTPAIVKKLIQEGIKPRQIHWTALVYHVPTGSPAYRKISKLFEQQGKLAFD